jgi:enoyl-CoA hydratase
MTDRVFARDEGREGASIAADLGRRSLLALAALGVAGTAHAASAQPAEPPGGGGAAGPVRVEATGGGVLLIGLDRPEAHNLVDVPTFLALGRAYRRLDEDDALRVAILYGVGPNFSRGLDVQAWGAALAAGPGQLNPAGDPIINPFGTIGAGRTKPVVAAAQGDTWFGGHELFLAADVRVAASDAVFSQGETARGLFPFGGATVRFVREAGWANAMRYMLTGDPWDAEEARRLGLVQDVVAPGRQLDRAMELARKIAAAAPLGVRATLASAHRAERDGEAAAYAALLPEAGRLLRSEDFQERVRALRKGRAPAYQGRSP